MRGGPPRRAKRATPPQRGTLVCDGTYQFPSAEGNFIPRRYAAGARRREGLCHVVGFAGELHYEIFAQVYFFNHFVLDDFGGGAVFQNFPIVQNITAVGNTQRFANVVVGDNYAQTAIF